MKCKYKKICPYYNEVDHTCNIDQFKEEGESYCGKYRELDKK
jgi:hypothetical protein